MRSRKAPPNEYALTLRQGDQARTDFAAIADDPELIMVRVAKVPTRRDLVWAALAAFAGGAACTTFANLILGR